jgi:hypothetical protein
MRSYAARYSEQNQNKISQGAVKTARMLRGRQFGELIGVEYNTKEALDISKLKLKPDEITSQHLSPLIHHLLSLQFHLTGMMFFGSV